MSLELVLRAVHRPAAPTAPRPIVTTTLDAMASGGMYDHLGGGFARYSVDERVARPALREDALRPGAAARVYLHAWQVHGATAVAPGRRRDDRRTCCATCATGRRLLLGRGRRLARRARPRPRRAVLHLDARRDPRRPRRRRLGRASTGTASPTRQLRGTALDPEPARVTAASWPARPTIEARAAPCCSRPATTPPPGARRQGPHRVERADARRHSPRRPRRSADRTGSTRPSPTPSSCSRELRRPDGRWQRRGRPTAARSPPRRARRRPRRARRCVHPRSPRRPDRPAGSTRPARPPTRCSTGSGIPSNGGLFTTPTTASSSSCARRTCSTTPRRRRTRWRPNGAATVSRRSPASRATPTTPTRSCSCSAAVLGDADRRFANLLRRRRPARARRHRDRGRRRPPRHGARRARDLPARRRARLGRAVRLAAVGGPHGRPRLRVPRLRLPGARRTRSTGFGEALHGRDRCASFGDNPVAGTTSDPGG